MGKPSWESCTTKTAQIEKWEQRNLDWRCYFYNLCKSEEIDIDADIHSITQKCKSIKEKNRVGMPDLRAYLGSPDAGVCNTLRPKFISHKNIHLRTGPLSLIGNEYKLRHQDLFHGWHPDPKVGVPWPTPRLEWYSCSYWLGFRAKKTPKTLPKLREYCIYNRPGYGMGGAMKNQALERGELWN